MTLPQRFGVVCIAVLAVCAVVFGSLLTRQLEAGMLLRARELTADWLLSSLSFAFTHEELSVPRLGKDYDEFTQTINHLVRGTDILRIKIWHGHTVVWSDEAQLVGLEFGQNQQLDLALENNIVAELTSAGKDEHEFEKDYGRMLELYVPVRLPGDDDVLTIAELYLDLEPLDESLRDLRRGIWLSIGLMVLVIYFALYSMFWHAHRLLVLRTDALAASEERYRTLLESAPEGIIVADGEKNIVLSNETAARLFGYEVHELARLPVLELFATRDMRVFQEALRQLIRNFADDPAPIRLELAGRRKDGGEFPLELALAVTGVGDYMLATLIITDITERKAVQERLVEAERHAMAVTVSASTGHELSNAVTGMLGYTTLLEEADSDDERNESVKMIKSLARRLKLHAQDLMTLGKRREPKFEQLQLSTVFARVADMLTASGLLKRITVHRELDESLLVTGDAGMLEQVFANLLINAAHALELRGEVWLTVRRGEEGYAEALVHDNGPGIPEDIRERIFTPFFTTKAEGKGTGLGLYVVHQLVQQHTGYITLDTAEGEGTTFTIGLPLAE